MSRRHLIIEGYDNSFRLRDVGSANGTFVNNSRIQSIELCDGDQIKAGQSVFDVSVIQDTENPNAKDVTFNTVVESMMIEHGEAVVGLPGADATSADRDDTRQNAMNASDHAEAKSVRPLASDETQNSHDWSELGFEPVDQPGLYRQLESESQHRSVESVLEYLEADYSVSAIVNQRVLRRFDRRLIEHLEDKGLVTRQENSMCVVANDGCRDFKLLSESLLGQDACTFVGVRQGNAVEFSSELCKLLECPSALTATDRGKLSSELLTLLRQRFDWLLFEQSAVGELCLLIPSELA